MPTLSQNIIQKARSRSKGQRSGAKAGGQARRKAGRNENLKVIKLNHGVNNQRANGLRDSTSTLGTGQLPSHRSHMHSTGMSAATTAGQQNTPGQPRLTPKGFSPAQQPHQDMKPAAGGEPLPKVTQQQPEEARQEMSFAAHGFEDASTLFGRRPEPQSATAESTGRARLHSGGMEIGNVSLPESRAGRRAVREVGVGSGNVDQSAESVALLSREGTELGVRAYGNASSRERQLRKQVSLGDLMSVKPVDAGTKSKLARSRSLAMLGKSTSKTKNGVI